MNLNDIPTSTFLLIAQGILCIPIGAVFLFVLAAGMAAKKAATRIVRERAAERTRRDSERRERETRLAPVRTAPPQPAHDEKMLLCGDTLDRLDAFVGGEERLTPEQLAVELLHAALAA